VVSKGKADMSFCVKDELTIDEYSNVTKFLDSLNFHCIEQHPAWNTKIEKYQRSFFFSTDEKGHINCFGNIILSKGPFKTASINFGPAFADYAVLTQAIKFLHDYFSTQKFTFFSIQLGVYINNQTELLEYNINNDYKVKYFFTHANSWTSICIDLKKPENDILKSFSKGHKSSIKSAYSKNNLRVSIENNTEHLQSFINLYIKMETARKLTFEKKEITHLFKSINDFMYENNKGFIEYIFEGNTLVGGLIILYQGNSARFYKGAGDPERRDIPVLHYGLFEAMKICKENGCTSLDLWGYNHFADKSDQLFYINRFKKGFGGDFTFFPKRMNFILKPTSFLAYKSLKYCKNQLKVILRKSA
jgi:lipid II:glycine glycyltransferase (peptidoglycan interpeptide bridge formation enzyme)